MIKKIASIARVCYQSFDKANSESDKKLIAHLVASGHHAMLEHHSLTLKIDTSRGITHELVRHRMASYAQESTRYVNYGNKGYTMIYPYGTDKDSDAYLEWLSGIKFAIKGYESLLGFGCTPGTARGLLPTDTKATVIMTVNLRELRHVLSLRAHSAAHIAMQELMYPTAAKLHLAYPIFFDPMPIPAHLVGDTEVLLINGEFGLNNT